MAVTIQIRRDEAADWTAANPVLALGEIGIEVDTNKAKYGDGFTAWSALDYWITDIAALETLVNDHIADGTIHFLQGDIDHTVIQNIGTNDHPAIDAHIADAAIHQPVQAARKNLLMNGDMEIWQRGNSFTSSEGYTADRWSVRTNGAAVNQDTDVPPGQEFTKSLRVQPVGATLNTVQQAVELPATGEAGVFQVGETFTLSFWATADVGEQFTLTLRFRNGTNTSTDEVIASNTVVTDPQTGAGAWQKHTAVFTISQAPNVNNTCMSLFIVTPESSAWKRLTGFQLERGDTATDFEYVPIAAELALCKRYFQTIGGGAASIFGSMTNNNAALNHLGFVPLPVELRVTPTVTTPDGISGWQMRSSSSAGGGSYGFTSITVPAKTSHGVKLTIAVSDNTSFLVYSALYCSNAARMFFDAEL